MIFYGHEKCIRFTVVPHFENFRINLVVIIVSLRLCVPGGRRFEEWPSTGSG